MKISLKVNNLKVRDVVTDSAEITMEVEMKELMEYAEKMQDVFTGVREAVKESNALEHERALEIQKGEKEILKQQLEIAKLMK